MREGVVDSNYSVYHRAKFLAPIFPWLLFTTALHPFITTTRVATAAAVVEDASASSHLRGMLMRRNNIPNKSHRYHIQHHHRQRHLTSTTVQNYCGVDWTDANSKCLIPCPDGDDAHTICGEGESCFADLTSCPSMIVLGAEESGLPPPQPTSLQGQGSSPVIAGVDGGGGGFTSSYTATADSVGAVAAPSSTLESTGDNIASTAISSSSSSTTTTLPFQIGAIIPTTCPTTTTNSVNVGYYQSWAKYRSSNCNPITPSQIPVSIFGYTHLIYSFAGISNSGELEPYNGIMDEVALYEEFNSLKSSGNGGVTTLIAVGGWNLDQTLFSRISSSESTRSHFAKSVVEFLSLYNFDGLDLDWEYPVTREGTPEDYDNYPLLVQAIRDAMTEATTATGGKEYLLTMAVPVNPEKLDNGFHLSELAKHVDWFHLMSYDIHGSWDEVAGSNTDMEYISSTVENNILGKGVNGEQLVFGLASYGRSMVLTEPSTCTTAGCPISGSTMAGCSGESGFSPYFELKESYVDTGKYQSLLLNDKAASMEMILDGGIFISLDIDQTFLLKRDFYLSK
jgi:chitinase